MIMTHWSSGLHRTFSSYGSNSFHILPFTTYHPERSSFWSCVRKARRNSYSSTFRKHNWCSTGQGMNTSWGTMVTLNVNDELVQHRSCSLLPSAVPRNSPNAHVINLSKFAANSELRVNVCNGLQDDSTPRTRSTGTQFLNNFRNVALFLELACDQIV